jgi:hypothetical protein
MSILSSTQGTPERVWSLIVALSAGGGTLQRSEAADLLNPRFIQDGQIVQDEGFNQTLGAATSLGVVQVDEVDKAILRLNSSCLANDYITFGDWVHDRFISLNSGEKDAVLLQTYAWIAVESHRQNSVRWIQEWTSSDFADAADKALPEGTDDDGNRRINTTKLPSWRRWLICLGLLVPMPLSIQAHPAAAARATRELKNAEIQRGTEIPADEFLKVLNARLPYLDGGRMFLEAAKRLEYVPSPRQLSPLLSATLRNLDDEKVIELLIRGDAGNVVRLSEATHKVQSFHAVVVSRGTV